MKKLITISIISLVLGVVIIPFLCLTPNLNESQLKQIMQHKAGLELSERITIKKFECSSPLGSDYAEMYEIELSLVDYIKAIEEVKKSKTWQKDEFGYTLMILKRTFNDTIFIFQIDTVDNRLIMNIIEE